MCDYVLLKNLSRHSGKVPVPRRTVTGVQIIPDYKAPTPDTLTHGVRNPGCSGFFNIMNAYGRNAAQCNQQYSMRKCQ